MGHCIHAIIGHEPVNKEQAKELGLALIFESDFVIVPLIEDNIYHYEVENNIDSLDFGDDVIWDCTVTVLFAKLLGFKKHVIATLSNPDFLGSYYEGNQKIANEININSALGLLGVPKGKDTEFEYLNFNKYRNSEFYYMDQIIGHKETSNIIKGTLLQPDWNKT